MKNYSFLIGFCFLFTFVFAPLLVNAQSKPQKAKEIAKNVTSEKVKLVNGSLQIEFPEVDGWEVGEKTEFPTKELGYSVRYTNPSVTALTIYVYNGGKKKITTKEAEMEIERSYEESLAMQEMGYYSNVKKLKTDARTVGKNEGKQPASILNFSFTMRGQNLNSQTLIAVYKDHFIKIRASYPVDDDEALEEVNNLLDGLDSFFAAEFK